MNDYRVRDWMTRDVVTVTPGDLIVEAARQLATHGISAAPVLEDGGVVGMISESDILHALAAQAPRTASLSILDHLIVTGRRRPRTPRGTPSVVRDVMTTMVVGIHQDASIWEAAAAMGRHGVKRLPVTDGGRLTGILSRADLIRAMARTEESIRADIVHAMESLGESSTGIDVAVADGTVTLSGAAPDPETGTLAARLASRVPGVCSVDNRVTVGPVHVHTGLDESDLAMLDPFRARRARR